MRAERQFEIQTEHFGSLQIESRDCPLCGRDNADDPSTETAHSLEPWTVRRCADCGFVYIDAAPSYAAQHEQLAWERTTKVEERRRSELRPISYRASKWTRFRMHMLPRRTVPAILQRHIPGGNVVDLGCGDGAMLAALPPSFTPFGIEISTALAERADTLFGSRGGRAVNASSLDGLTQFPDGFFAAASLRSYLEHESHPLPVLRELYRVLDPAGIAVVKVPNFASLNRRVMGRRWCGFRYPDHLNYFTPASLSSMAAQCGFRTCFGLTGRLPTGDNMWAVLSRDA